MNLEPKPELRLFCFPYAGGNSSLFRNWPASLPATIEVHAVELPGRQSRFKERALTQMSLLAHTLARELAPSLDLPFALFGHSMGALLAFEIARELRRLNAPQPVHLFVSAQGGPHLPHPRTLLHLLPDQLFLEQVGNHVPPAALRDAELLRMILPTLRADIALSETYSYYPELPLACPITAMGGVTDPSINHLQLNAWQVHTTGPFNLFLFRGNHAYIHTETPLLLQTIQSQLRR
ncbi:MAG TPA: alpha/beta fold hydrolase [Pyrinomonadaceae bacterium]|nr:alpha/beta fold hydrolase [Pyrinomonadaceae bacterium]